MTDKSKISAILLAVITAFLLHFTASFEGTKYKPYHDVGGISTVCTGHTGKDIVNKKYTQAECDALLKKDLMTAGRGVLACVHKPMTISQLQASTDFAFNLGVGAFCNGSVAREFNEGNPRKACDNMLKYNIAGGHVMAGLKRRREAERNLCLSEKTL